MDLEIAGKRALVCGASRGLGLACAQALAAEGVHPILVARSEQSLRRAAELIESRSGRAPEIIVADLSIEREARSVLERCGTPDILITNAGGPRSDDFRNLTRDDWVRAFEANFHAAELLIRSTIGHMIERKFGRIVNITSMTVRSPIQDLDLSNATRLALTGYVAGVARKVASSNVTINNLLPGPIMTERLAALGALATGLIERVPAGRAGSPEEFGAVCAFLCSRQAAFMTGQNLLVDGGLCSFSV